MLKKCKRKPTDNIHGNSQKANWIFSAETLQVRREWHNIFRVMKGENLQPEYSARLSFRLMERLKFYKLAKKLRVRTHSNQLYNKH